MQNKLVGVAIILAGAVLGWGWWNGQKAAEAYEGYLKAEGEVQHLKTRLAVSETLEKDLRALALRQGAKVKELQDKLDHAPKPVPPKEPPKTVVEIANDMRLRWGLEPNVQNDSAAFRYGDLSVLHRWGQVQEQYPVLERRYGLLEQVSSAQSGEIDLLSKTVAANRNIVAEQGQIIAKREEQIQLLNQKIKAESRKEWSTRAKWAGAGVLAGFIIAKH